MAQTFQYPNLMSGTDKWTDWWKPPVGKSNTGIYIADISLPRPIEQDDIVCVSVEMEFDRLDLTADTAFMQIQGPVDNSWHTFNVFTAGFKKLKHDVFCGMMELSNTFRVNSRTYNTGAVAYNTTPVGHSVFTFGFRVDCSGGRSVCGVSWSSSTRRAHLTRGHRQRARCGLR